LIKKLSIILSYLKYRNIRKFSAEKLKSYQQKALARHLRFLQKKSPYFRDLFKQGKREFQKIPVSNKKHMMEHFDSLVTVYVNKKESFELALQAERTRDFTPTLNGVTLGLSSGTSDHRGLFVTSPHEMNLWTGAILARVLPPGKGPFRVAFFLRANSNLYENVGSRKVRFRYYDIYRPMEEHLRSLNDYQPHLLVAPPSVLILLGQAAREGSLKITPEKIVSVAEVLEKEDALRLCRQFDQPVIHQVYQCTEGFLGFTCEQGTLHLNEDMVFIEKEKLDEQRFIPLISDFTRRSQPIMRYRLNDILVERKEPCPCGCPFTSLDSIEGREDDIFRFPGPENKEVILFPDMIRRLLLYVESIQHYQILQRSTDHVECYLDNLDQSVCQSLEKEFIRLSEQMAFTMPRLSFHPYEHRTDRKLKRIIAL